MITKDQIESWILDYACKYKYHKVVTAISARCNGQLTLFGIPEVRLVTCTVHKIMSTNDVRYFEDAIEQLETIFKSCPELLPFKLYTKLCSGLKMKVLLTKLESKDKDVLIKLNKFFPRTGTDYVGVRRKEIAKLHSLETNFRKFVLPLMANENQRKAYFRDEYQEEFGDRFMKDLLQLTMLFSDRIEGNLPPTAIDKILENGFHTLSCIVQDSPDILVEILLDTIQGKTELTEKDLVDMLTMVSPVCTQDRLHINYQVSFENLDDSPKGRTGSESLFSSENSDSKNRQLPEKDSNQNSESQNDSVNMECKILERGETLNKKPQDIIKMIVKPDSTSRLIKNQIPATILKEDITTDLVKKSFLERTEFKRTADLVPRNDSDEDKEHDVTRESSEESISLLATRCSRNTRSSKKLYLKNCSNKRPKEDIPEQVYTISSSSDSNPSQPSQGPLRDDSNPSHPYQEPLHIYNIPSDSHDSSQPSQQIQDEDMDDNINVPVEGNSDVEIYICESTDDEQNRSVSDVDKSDREEVIPPSRTEDLEFWDVFERPESPEIDLYHLPSIKQTHPDVRLCVVKLYRKKELDVKKNGLFHMYA